MIIASGRRTAKIGEALGFTYSREGSVGTYLSGNHSVSVGPALDPR